MSYEDVLKYMYEQLPMFHRVGPAAYKPGLETTARLLELTGNPHKKLKCVHVAGTNGKGSTSHLIASALQEAGYKTGLYTSPHLKDFRERIRVDGEMIEEEEVVEFVLKYKTKWEGFSPSFFEMTVALAFWYFEKEETDINVIEVGLGGRLDSTNVIFPEVSVITNIGYDHMNLLGDTIEKIAAEKAGIIKENIPVVCGTMRTEALEVIMERAYEMDSPIFLSEVLEPGVVPESDLKGIYQDENRKTAWQALDVLREIRHWKIPDKAIERGFASVAENTGLAGRWQVLNNKPLTIADVAHNEDGLLKVMEQVNEIRKFDLRIVLGMVEDKDISRALNVLPKEAIYYFCKASIPRAMPAETLREKALQYDLKGEAFGSVQLAYKQAREDASVHDMILVTGSVFVVAEV